MIIQQDPSGTTDSDSDGDFSSMILEASGELRPFYVARHVAQIELTDHWAGQPRSSPDADELGIFAVNSGVIE